MTCACQGPLAQKQQHKPFTNSIQAPTTCVWLVFYKPMAKLTCICLASGWVGKRLRQRATRDSPWLSVTFRDFPWLSVTSLGLAQEINDLPQKRMRDFPWLRFWTIFVTFRGADLAPQGWRSSLPYEELTNDRQMTNKWQTNDKQMTDKLQTNDRQMTNKWQTNVIC